VDCGYPYSPYSLCMSKGCCWVTGNAGPWCFYKTQCSSNCNGGAGTCSGADGACTGCRSGYSGPACSNSAALNSQCKEGLSQSLSKLLDAVVEPKDACEGGWNLDLHGSLAACAGEGAAVWHCWPCCPVAGLQTLRRRPCPPAWRCTWSLLQETPWR
jgi:hypothetical protein